MRRSNLNEQSLREAVAYLHGRAERELEAFANSIAIPALELTTRVGALLCGAGQRHDHRMPGVPSSGYQLGAGAGSGVLAEVEGAIEPHRGGTRTSAKASGAPVKVDARKVNNRGWGKFKTPEARRKEARRRMMMRKDPLAKAMIKNWDRGKKGKTKTRKNYNARSRAKAKGLPQPPLPSAAAAA